jgi:hypothetical protein
MELGISRKVVLSLVLGLAACGGDDSFSPTEETVAGSYTASTFTLTTSAGTTNLLGQGATVSLNLAADGTTTGRLFVPGGADDGGDLEEDLVGTWTLVGSTVTFNQAADTFIPDTEFLATRNTLTGEDSFGGTTLRLVLTKTG